MGTRAILRRLLRGVLATMDSAHRPPPASPLLLGEVDLLSQPRNAAVEAMALDRLDAVVFDTETTGLNPATDAIVQVAGVGLRKGRLDGAEVFDALVDPGRPIPPANTRIHGIDDAAVAGQPSIARVAADFHGFVRGRLLVAHNAAFDLAFLHRAQDRAGVRFDHPVIDTVLLSALVYGPGAGHSLDALCARLGILIPPHERHTALGDTRATARALLALVQALQARGLRTLGDVHEALRAL
ncbi:MAG: 3'-5' exonuclease [Lysobacteraceae bacterium]